MRVARMLALPIAASLLAAGCGGDDEQASQPAPPTPQQQVREAARKLLASRDAAAVCRTMVTDRFVGEIFAGDLQACVDSEITDPPDEGTQEVADVALSGTRARVMVVLKGGPNDGVGGHYAFTREGTTWKLDGFEDDAIRATMVAAIGQAGKGEGTSAFTYAPLRSCVRERVPAMAPAKLRAFVGASLRRDSKEATRLGNGFLQQCPRELAAYAADRIVDVFAEDTDRSPAFVRCARRELRALLWATGLTKDVLKGNVNDMSTAALQGLLLGVNKACSRSTGDAAA